MRLRDVPPKGREAIIWIAFNDDDSEMDPEQIRYQLTVVLVADLWTLDPEEVALKIVDLRRKRDAVHPIDRIPEVSEDIDITGEDA